MRISRATHAISALLTVTFMSANLPPVVSAQQDLYEAFLAPAAVAEFYDSQPQATVWNKDGQMADLISALQGLDQHGLNPFHYHLAALQSETDPQLRDRLATDAWFSAAAHMLYGKLDPVTIEPDWTAIGRDADLAGSLRTALAKGDIAGSLEQFAPRQKGYLALVDAYRHEREQSETAVVTVPPGPVLKTGMTGERVERLQKRLQQLELLSENQVTAVMDVSTTEALKLFQEDAELDADGMAGPVTLSALNIGQQEKLEKLRVNMERWRWLPEELGRRHLRANIAGFNVTAWEDGTPVRTYLTIVGKTYRKTPVFADQIEYIVFNPWWEVPSSLARTDKLPLFRNDPSLVTDLGFQVLDSNGQQVDAAGIDWNAISPGNFPYRLRQAPGEQNALGQVKIMFPNAHNVYLHDTPTRGLFSQRQRAFSSGCLRTENPLDLAAWLLEENTDWNRSRIDAAVNSNQETRVNLRQRVPVYILYFTVVNEERAGVRYLDDIYQRDDAVLAGLRERPF